MNLCDIPLALGLWTLLQEDMLTPLTTESVDLSNQRLKEMLKLQTERVKGAQAESECEDFSFIEEFNDTESVNSMVVIK